jgi:hypothetical protein
MPLIEYRQLVGQKAGNEEYIIILALDFCLVASQQALYFFFDPQGQGLFLETF